MFTLDHNLEQFATEKQWRYLKQWEKHGSQRRAQQAEGTSIKLFDDALKAVKKKAAAAGYAPEFDMTKPVPDGFSVKGVSTLYDSDGHVKAQWVKSNAEQEEQERALREFCEGLKESIPKAKPATSPRRIENDLLNLFVITDYHLGMLAWPEETGDDWNIKIAEETLVRWFAEAIKRAPDAPIAVLGQLGDFLHWDGMEAVTPAHGHVLDADTRFQLLVRTGIRCLRRVVALLLEKYPSVHVIMGDANHDPASGVWMREFLAAHYDDEPRVNVDTSPDTYYCYEYGKTALFFHHGHKRTVDKVDTVFAGKFREIFGRTKYAYAHTGHLHHLKALETNLMIVEQHRTLAAKDAFASRGGYLAGRSASVITYSKTHGEVARATVSPEMLGAK